MASDRLLYAPEVEAAVLGAALIDPVTADRVVEDLSEADFADPRHQAIYRAIAALAEAMSEVNTLTVQARLTETGELDRVGGVAAIYGLDASLPDLGSVPNLITILHDRALRRAMVDSARTVTNSAREDDGPADALLAKHRKALDDAEQASGRVGEVREACAVAEDVLRVIRSPRDARRGIMSGIGKLDMITGGLQPKRLYVLAGRPGVGKSGFAQKYLQRCCMDGGSAIFVSLEMGSDELLRRMLSTMSGVDHSHIQPGRLQAGELDQLLDAQGEMEGWKAWLSDEAIETPQRVLALARRHKREHGLDLLIVDYLQLMAPDRKYENRNLEVAAATRAMKLGAMELDCPILLLSQLNREAQGKRPTLANLRDCLPGDALVWDADTGERVSVEELARWSGGGVNVWALDDRLKLVKRPVIDAWRVNEQEVFIVTTRSGRRLRCTAGHRLLTAEGWRELRDLEAGDAIATPRRVDPPARAATMSPGRALLLGWLIGDGNLQGSPEITVATSDEAEIAKALAHEEFGIPSRVRPEREGAQALRVVLSNGPSCGRGINPLTRWLRGLGIWGLTGASKVIPEEVFRQPDDVVAAFLRGLFHADGSITVRGRRSTVRLVSISEDIARGAQHLLTRLGIVSHVRCDSHQESGFRTQVKDIWTTWLGDMDEVERFMDVVGFLGEKHRAAMDRLPRGKRNDAASLDRLPLSVNLHVSRLRLDRGLSHPQLGWRNQGKRMSRETAAMLADRLDDPWLEALATSDVQWDEIASIDPDGVEQVFDVSVGDLHNLVVDGICTHNSGAVEQDSDAVIFMWSPNTDDEETESWRQTKGKEIEIDVAKNRNGPTGSLKVNFWGWTLRFQEVAA